jgi:hypothetical protein
VTLRGEPLPGVPVRFDGERVGTTGPGGEVRARVPVANRLVVAATTDAGVTVRHPVDWMLVPFLAGPLALAALAGGGAYGYRRTDATAGDALARGRTLVDRASSAALAALVAGAEGVERLLAGLGRALAAVERAIREGLATVGGRLRDALAAVTGLEVPSLHPLAALSAWLARLRARLRSSGSDRSTAVAGERDLDADLPDDGGADAAAVADESLGPRERVLAAWRTLVRRARVTRYRTRTPGEVRARALSAGLPADAVETLTEAFREVEYGAADPREWLDAVADAVARLEDEE